MELETSLKPDPKTWREALAWIRFIQPALNTSNDIVLLGLGAGWHVQAFQKQYPHVSLTIIDPRQEEIRNFAPQSGQTIRYIYNLSGVQRLAQILHYTTKPIPILEYRPCWNDYQSFFNEALNELMGWNELASLQKTPAHFILESLFV